jgi:Transmembrane protein of unknown function (DUF3556)
VRQADIGVAEAHNIRVFTAQQVGSSGVGPGRLLVTIDGDWKPHAAEVDRRKPLINHGKTTADLVWTIDKESIMGFTEPNFPRVEPEAFLKAPFLERVKTLTLNWVENGYGVPRMVHAIYIVKLVFFYALGGIVVATLTSGLPAFWHVSEWWNQPIVYQKAILWTVLLETIGVAGSWGPLAGKTKPMIGGILYWARPGTIRLRPWRRVPLTAGNRRTGFDVAL